MDTLFELAAALTLDTAEFIKSLNQAETSAAAMQTLLDTRMTAAASSLTSLQSTASGVWSAITSSIQTAINKTREFLSMEGRQSISVSASTSSSGDSIVTGTVKAMATGMPYVPYDNYAARLHEGEAVLTKLEAARWREGEGSAAQVDLSGLAQTITGALSSLTVEMDGEAVGRMTSSSVSREISQAAAGRRYSP